MLKKSFTLLEMLIVLGIIAVILSIVTVAYSTTQKKSRDAKRKSDMKNMQNALEQYYSVCGYVYPTGISPNGIMCGGSPAILTGMPVDPKTATPYVYSTTAPSAGFSLCTTNLESESPTGYCVYNQQ